MPFTLMAEEGASLSSGSMRMYAIPNASSLIPNSAIGCVDLYNYDPLNRRTAVGIMVSKEYRRQGYALAMLQALASLYTSDEGVHGGRPLHVLYADIAASNSASIALFKKAGYEECGHFKEWLNVDGKYIDTIRMQKIL